MTESSWFSNILTGARRRPLSFHRDPAGHAETGSMVYQPRLAQSCGFQAMGGNYLCG